jgi:NAD(P)-dependent dehydrogenase (short-subunit alcohol dehydrogenase family)
MKALDRFSLAGKVALVTGASRGIGRATAIGFAQAGADIVLISRNTSDLEKAAEEIRQEGRKALVVSTHLGRMDSVRKVIDSSMAEFGKIDILVNNAGISPAFASFLDTEEKLWDSIMNLNLKGLFFLGQAAARVMKQRGSGCIINVSSIVSNNPETDNGVYAISKAGIVSATKVMAKELAEYNIRVNAVAPGYIHTGLLDLAVQLRPERETEYVNTAYIKRIGETEEVVGAMIYLASPAASYVTGHTIFVDGGFVKI